MNINYYEVLGIASNATLKEIQQAYKKLAHKYHPDMNGGDKECEERMKQINIAYSILSDEKLRAEYDVQEERGSKHNHNPASGVLCEPW